MTTITATVADPACATHVRITDGGAPEFITARQALDEMNAAQMGPTKRNVRTASSDQDGRAMFITYVGGRKVHIRPATKNDRPAETTPAPVETQPEERHVTPFAGGKVHLELPGLGDDHPFPLCRTGAMTNSGAKYRFTDAPVDCANCTEQLRRRALRAARLAAEAAQ
jgi:hypothetical protein